MGRGLFIIVLGMSLIVSLARINLSQTRQRAGERVDAQWEQANASNNAVGIAKIAVARLQDGTDATATDPTNYPTITMPNGGTATIVSIQTNGVAPGLPTAWRRVLARGSQTNAQDVNVVVDMGTRSFSEYFLFVDNWSAGDYLITGDSLWGPIHSNGKMYLWGSPFFQGRVSTGASGFGYIGNNAASATPDFRAGTPTFNTNIPFPSSLNIDQTITTAQAGGKCFNYNAITGVADASTTTWLKFNTNGTVAYKSGSTAWQNTSLSTLAPNGIIASYGPIKVEGTIPSGAQVSVVSNGEIRIVNDLKYTDNPRTNPSATNVLGLIAKGNVTVADTATTRDGISGGPSSGLQVDASVFTLGSFAYENYQTIPFAGNIQVLGGVVQKNRGINGIFDPSTGTITHGFQERHRYDERFNGGTFAPPGFPVQPGLVVKNWYQTI